MSKVLSEDDGDTIWNEPELPTDTPDRHEALWVILREFLHSQRLAKKADTQNGLNTAWHEAAEAIEALYAEAEQVARLDELEQLINTGWPNGTKRYDDGDVAEIVTVEDIEERIAELSLPQQAGGEQHGPSK